MKKIFGFVVAMVVACGFASCWNTGSEQSKGNLKEDTLVTDSLTANADSAVADTSVAAVAE